jgi:hypothetical protein
MGWKIYFILYCILYLAYIVFILGLGAVFNTIDSIIWVILVLVGSIALFSYCFSKDVISPSLWRILFLISVVGIILLAILHAFYVLERFAEMGSYFSSTVIAVNLIPNIIINLPILPALFAMHKLANKNA